jgi:hypothetical protein
MDRGGPPVIADYRYKCRAVEVLDATTVIATIDLGFRHVVTIPLRLLALDEHEPGTDAYRRARRYLRTPTSPGATPASSTRTTGISTSS